MSLELLLTVKIVPVKHVDAILKGNKNVNLHQYIFSKTVSPVTSDNPQWGGGRKVGDD